MKVKKSLKKKRGGANIPPIPPPSYNNVLQENNRIDLLENRIEKIESYINTLVYLVYRGLSGDGPPPLRPGKRTPWTSSHEHFKAINKSTVPSVFN